MRKIKFKSASESRYKVYIDIGSCEKHYDMLPLFKPDKVSFSKWQETFLKHELGVQMLTLHYYHLEYSQDYFLPDEIKAMMEVNLQLIAVFINKWFEADWPQFKGLDLNWEGFSDEIDEAKYNEFDVMTHVKFKNGDQIKFLDADDDKIESFYVLENQYDELVEDFKPVQDVIAGFKS